MEQHRTILLVDGDAAARAALAAALGRLIDAAVVEAGGCAEAWAALEAHRIDAIIMDLALPDGDGRDVCRRLRAAGRNVPVLLLACDRRESDVINGLEAGANDFLEKPCGAAELAARLRAQWRAFEDSEHAEIVIGPFVFRPGAKLLHDPRADEAIRLTGKEAAVLKYLYRANGEPVRREALLHDVWGYSPRASTHTVETHIYRLRRKLESTAFAEQLLINDRSGYRLRLRGRGRLPRLAEACLAMAI